MNREWLNHLLASGRGDGLRAQLLRGGMGVGLLKMLSLPLMLLATILLARGLGPEGFGQYAFVIALITTLSIPLGPALMQLTTRETAGMHQAGEEDRIRSLLHWANRHVWIGSMLIVATVGGIAVWMTDWRVDDRWALLLLGLVALPLLGFSAVRSGILAGLRRVVLGQLPDLFVRPLVLLIVTGVLLLVGVLNPATAMAAFIAGVALAFVVSVVLLRRTFPEGGAASEPIQPEQNRQWIRAWMPFTLLMAASTLNSQVGILLLGWLGSNEEVAAMQVADRGGMLVVLSLTVVNLVIGPHITRVHRSGDSAQLQALSRHSARMALLVALPIALPLIFFGAPILNTVFGAEYAEIATLPLAILAIAQLINVAFGSIGMLLTMSGFERDTLRGQVFALVINVIAAMVLIPIYGVAGAAFAAALGLVMWNVVLAFLVMSRLDIRPGLV
ncbi:oligosaccharide flippase family protein [Thiohalomonas denitrificans]|uniref:Membrane protein involved in the export of O-antigen and teichoic acid n=1 Tax=Thiohalomonas denitrificans TaxID=415747 RepID=A0A1G5R080_9GAMM|nr:oligosaccharide flippase family protein [Thiohalomonas denitrificans]SCZ67387.1 Membrane protein involved in the export of O-antigen and teichoic acid [Thiohalomonas denitrificans]